MDRLFLLLGGQAIGHYFMLVLLDQVIGHTCYVDNGPYLSHGMFFPLGRFFLWDVFSVRHFVLERFVPMDVLSVRRLVFGRFVLGLSSLEVQSVHPYSPFLACCTSVHTIGWSNIALFRDFRKRPHCCQSVIFL